MRSFPAAIEGALAALLLFAGSAAVTAQEARMLFDGKSLDGWHRRGGQARFSVEQPTGGEAGRAEPGGGRPGVIVGRSVPNTDNTFLCTDRHYSDFELEYEFKVDPRLNSGVQIRSHEVNGRVAGYQIEIDGDDARKRYWTGGIYDESRRGWLDDLEDNQAARNAFKPREWNHIRVLAVGSRLRTWINGVPAADLLDSLTLSGFIGLQVHGVGGRKDPLEVRWRNITLRDLGAHRWRSLFDGVSVPSWALSDSQSRGARLDGRRLELSAAAEMGRAFRLPGDYANFTLRAIYASARGGLYRPGALRRGEPEFRFRKTESGNGSTISFVTWWGGSEGRVGGFRGIEEPVTGPAMPAGGSRSVTTTVEGSAGAVHLGGKRITVTDRLSEAGAGGLIELRPDARIVLDQLQRLEPVTIAPTLGLAPASGATVLLGPESGWRHFRKSGADGDPGWALEEGVAEVVRGQGSIETQQTFSDFQLHLEFAVTPDEGNSGVYIQRRYEVQILNSYNQPDDSSNCGALYRYRRPDINVSLPPGEWQSYDITFTAPRWNEHGEKSANARITVVHNGVTVHDDVELPRKTGAGKPEGPEPGPILLQDHGSRVRYRNIWITRR